MRFFLLLWVAITLQNCARKVEPTPDNINTIFDSKDFTFEFHPRDGDCMSLSFRNDYLVYKSDLPTVRREISFEEVVRINNFIQEIVNLHQPDLKKEFRSYYIIKNTAYQTTIIPDQMDDMFYDLITSLGLKIK